MSLRNLFRHQAEAPTLRERAAELRASLPANRPQQIPTSAADSAPAAVQEPVGIADPIFAAIEEHVAARDAFSAVCPDVDKAARRDQGLDTSDEAMAPAHAAWDAGNAKEIAAWNALFAARPTTLAGALAMVCHAQKWAPENVGVDGALFLKDILGGIAEGLAGAILAETAPSKLVRDLLDGWAAWGPGVNEVDDSAEGIAAWEQSDTRRNRLIHTAMALPATPENIFPKALACAWMEWVNTERPGQPRDAYGPADQLVYDIHATIMGRSGEAADLAVTEAATEATSGDAAAPTDLDDACLWAVRHRAWIDQEMERPVEWSDERFDAETGKVNAVFTRAIEEPSAGLREIAAKASLALEDYERFVMTLPGEHDDGQRIVHTVLREAAALTGNADTVAPATTMEPNLVSLVDFSGATMEELRAVYEIADELCTAGHAQAWMGRCKVRGSDWDLNPAGQLAQRIGDALIEVVSATISEARARVPANDDDRRIRFEILARSIVQNDDPAETAAFARELLASVEGE